MSEVEKMNEAMYERLGEIAKFASNKRVELDPDFKGNKSDETQNRLMLGAFRKLRQMVEFYKPEEKEPVVPGCPSLMPRQLPGGFDGVEAAEKEKVEELQKRGAKIKACNERSSARIFLIEKLAEECLRDTNHPNGYEPGQYGQDYRTFGKAMCEIRKLVRESVADVAPDYEMLALQFARNSFDFAKFQEALAAVASMKAEDFPGVYYTPGWLCELAKKLQAQGQVREDSPNSPDSRSEAKKAAKDAEYFRKHYSFCDGLFPIRFSNTEDGQMASCWINGRRFTLDLDSNERDDDKHDCAAIIKDNGRVIATIETTRGKSISGSLCYGAFKAYVRNLSGSGKFSSRGGFLKLAAKRAAAAKAAQKEVK